MNVDPVATAQIAIAVVSWNTKDLLRDCLASLQQAHADGLAEVHVVDNASTDGSAAMVAQEFSWVTLEAREDNLGYGAAVNLVADRTRTPWVAPANSDLRFAPDALRKLLDAAARAPRAGAFAPRLVMPDGRTQHSVHPFPTVRTGLLLSTGLALRPPHAQRLPMEGAWDPDVERDVDWAHGAFVLVRREAWDRIGGFDATQWLYAEDLDLCWRLRQAGWATRYVPSATVHHHVSAGAKQAWADGERAVRTQRSAYAWMLARQGLPRTRASALAHLAGPALRWAAAAAGAKVAPGRFAARRDTQRVYVAMHRTGLEPRAALERHHRGG